MTEFWSLINGLEAENSILTLKRVEYETALTAILDMVTDIEQTPNYPDNLLLLAEHIRRTVKEVFDGNAA